jgi:hypothetical protein
MTSHCRDLARSPFHTVCFAAMVDSRRLGHRVLDDLDHQGYTRHSGLTDKSGCIRDSQSEGMAVGMPDHSGIVDHTATVHDTAVVGNVAELYTGRVIVVSGPFDERLPWAIWLHSRHFGVPLGSNSP